MTPKNNAFPHELNNNNKHKIFDLAFELSLQKYLGRIDALPQSRLCAADKNLAKFEADLEVWDLIAVAVKHSAAVYKDIHAQQDYQGYWIKPTTVINHIKATSIEVVDIYGYSVVVVAIRGSASLDDWFLNLNGDPIAAGIEDVFDDTHRWHRGFLDSFRASEGGIADGIQKVTTKYPHACRILFTGHSAGGAIAQLCYNSCSIESSTIAKAIKAFNQINCVTFGAPPISTIPITPHTGSGVFLSVINEGDPVVLAQKEFIKAILSVYFLSKEDWDAKCSLGFAIPPAECHISGTCIVLRDSNEDGEEEVLEAVEVPASLVERTFFSNFLVHVMSLYCRRIDSLVLAAKSN
ncbi:hypothetical protein VHEMI04257 [[Torrubiella] hemipterigena]|uniref:Fungal lipase-type domain-containing protein n=1 Tax=[Torrubiella] hemipterigena TaxID=1531966 RepID=A0A0A1SUU2_9HYPO|nr:hypothetical protein VHEMI04257 [[Torrubiella] hemipterigena]